MANDLNSFDSTRKQMAQRMESLSTSKGSRDSEAAHGLENSPGGDSGRSAEEDHRGRHCSGKEDSAKKEAGG